MRLSLPLALPLAFATLFAFSSQASAKNLVETMKSADQFSILLRAAAAAGMDKMLAEPGPYTVFAPTDAAFNALPPGKLDMLMKPEKMGELKKILGYHVLFGRLTTKDLVAEKSAATATIGMPVVLEKREDGAVMVNDSEIAQPDIAADNGVIQVLDKVLIPAKPVQPKT